MSGYSAAISETQNDSGMHIIEGHFSLVTSRARWPGADMPVPLSQGPIFHISALAILACVSIVNFPEPDLDFCLWSSHPIRAPD